MMELVTCTLLLLKTIVVHSEAFELHLLTNTNRYLTFTIITYKCNFFCLNTTEKKGLKMSRHLGEVTF